MRWIYVPFMFALAFIYTKISLNDFDRREESEKALTVVGRFPSSVGELPVKKLKINRVPASIFYQNLNDRMLVQTFDQVSFFKGTTVGSIAVDSFGFLVDDKGKAFFSLQDFKEVSSGVLFHDVLSHLVSAKTHDKKISWMSYFEAYKKGLNNESHVYSYYVEKGLDDVKTTIDKKYEKNVSQRAPFTFTSFQKDYARVEEDKKAMMAKGLRKKYPEAEFFDFYESKKEPENFHVLVRFRPQDKISWVELLESSQCEYEKSYLKLQKVKFDERVLKLKNDVLEGRVERGLASVSFEKKSFIIKPVDQFSATLDLEQIPSDDYHDIVLDEAYVLGKIHRASLKGETGDYIKAWARIPASLIDEKAVELKYRLKDAQGK